MRLREGRVKNLNVGDDKRTVRLSADTKEEKTWGGVRPRRNECAQWNKSDHKARKGVGNAAALPGNKEGTLKSRGTRELPPGVSACIVPKEGRLPATK